MKVVVTGGAGFIGSHVTKVLCDIGHEVTVIDNLSTGFEQLIDSRANFVQLDLANEKELVNALKGHEAVIHLAGFIEVAESVRQPLKFAENNINGSLHLLEAMRQAQVKKIIFSSSACVYGVPQNLPISESDPLGVQVNPYGVTKIAVENFCSVYWQIHGFDCVILRYFNPYGPGELHKPETHAIPNFIKAVLDKKPIPLYWQGKQVRDFIYVEDLAKAHASVLNLSGWHVFNVGTEVGVKVIDVLQTIFKVVGYEVPINDLGERKGDVPATYASALKLQKTVGWKAEVGLEEGLRRTIEFYKNYFSSL